MIGFECLWCDQQVALYPSALAGGSITCPACMTQVDLVVTPLTVTESSRHDAQETELPLAA